MNEEQLLIFLRQAFAAERLGADVMKASKLSYDVAMQRVKALVEALPDESLVRQMLWKKTLPEIKEIFRSYNQEVATELSKQLGEYAPKQYDNATKFLNAGPGVNVAPAVPSVVSPGVAASVEAQVLGVRPKVDRYVQQILSSWGFKNGQFINSMTKDINTAVQDGILRGVSTDEIVNSLLPMKERLGVSRTKTVVRSAIQDFNSRVNQEVYGAHEDLFDGWEWVAVLDSRACPQCAGMEINDVGLGPGIYPKDQKPEEPPLHPNCRCALVPWWKDEEPDARPAQEVSTNEMTGTRAYKSKVKVKGERLFRKAKDVPTVKGRSPTYADFLAGANKTTQVMFFGGGQIGRARTEVFERYVKRFKDPQKALGEMINKGKFRKLATLE